jgi:regulator of sirC expression with transglutaminase-like and TPR domain
MKRILPTVLVLVSLGAIGLVVYSSIFKGRGRPLKADSIDQLLALPDDEIDVGLGALLIAKEYDPDLDVRSYLAKIDGMAKKLRSRIGDEKNPQRLITIMNLYIFEEQGFAPPLTEKVPRRRFLDASLDEKRATCTLYLALGERAGLPLFGVVTPDRVFVRYADGGARININLEQKGALLSDAEVLARRLLPVTQLARSFYMRELTKREFLGGLLHSLGIAYREAGTNADAVRAYRRALAIIPNSAETWCALSPALAGIRRLDEAVSALRKALEINPGLPEAWFNLALASYDKGDYRYAWSCVRKCWELRYEPKPEFLRALSAKMKDPGR